MTPSELLQYWLSAPDKDLAIFELGPKGVADLIDYLVGQIKAAQRLH